MIPETENLPAPLPDALLKPVLSPVSSSLAANAAKVVSIGKNASADLPVPLHQWTMPETPGGYIRQKENDCL